MLVVRGAGEGRELPLSLTRKKRAPSKPNFLLSDYSREPPTTSSRRQRCTSSAAVGDGVEDQLLPIPTESAATDLALLPSVALPGRKAPQRVAFGHVDGDPSSWTGTITSKGLTARNGLDALYWAIIDTATNKAIYNPVAPLQTFITNDGAARRIAPVLYEPDTGDGS